MDNRIGCSWSGGKDSCFALMKAAEQGYAPSVLINMMNENGMISRSHGLPLNILQQQAAAMGLPLLTRATSWKDYEQNFIDVLTEGKTNHAINAVVFGDIDLQAHRDWEEMVCEKTGLQAILPLWQQGRKTLVLEMLSAGIVSMIVSCNTVLGEEFLGAFLTPALIIRLEEKEVDVCGENGEFHTVVIDCPLFSQPLALPGYATVLHNNYWFIQWNA
ncbi:MAG: diphthine--ammonia ligase [Chitinophagaceae bacterium]